MSAAPATAGRNLVGVLGLVAFVAVLFAVLKTGDVWPWFARHPGTLAAASFAFPAALIAAVLSRRTLVAVAVGIAVAVTMTTVPSAKVVSTTFERQVFDLAGQR